jgi:ribosomal protein S18 acetylase RimI-like enzyme
MVRSDNDPAIRLYRNAGFEQLAVLDRDTKIGDSYRDGILMRKFVRGATR